LKTLEEPPPHVKFLLATTDPQKLPITVLSRCLQFNLKRLTPKLIRDRLELICKEEKIKADPAALASLARAADGSLRDALSLLDQAIAYCGGDVDNDAVGVMLGTIDRQHVNRLLQLLAGGDAAGIIAAIAGIDEQFPDYARLLDDLAATLQRIAIYQVVGAVDYDDDMDEAELAALAGSLSPEDVQLFYQTAITGRRDLYLAPDPRSGAEMTLLRMLAFQPGGSTGQSAERPARQNKPAVTAQPKPQAAPAPAPAPTAREQKSTGEETATVAASANTWQEPVWSELIEQLGINGAVKLLASNCAYVRRENNVLHLCLDGRSESLLTSSRQAALSKALASYFGEPLKAEIALDVIEAETPLQEEARKIDEGRDAAQAGLEADPNVKALKDMFGAQLLPDSVEVISNKSAANQE
jgi:DNA polymerase-3 subunit gamma/tau